MFKESELKGLLMQPIEEVEKLSKNVLRYTSLPAPMHTDRKFGTVLLLSDYEYSLRDAALIDFFVSGY